MLEAGAKQSRVRPLTTKKLPWRKRKVSVQVTNALLGAMLPVILLIAWEAAGAMGKLNPILLPTPSEILEEFVQLTASGELARHLGISAWRALLGFLLGGGLGLAAGIWVGFFLFDESSFMTEGWRNLIFFKTCVKKQLILYHIE